MKGLVKRALAVLVLAGFTLFFTQQLFAVKRQTLFVAMRSRRDGAGLSREYAGDTGDNAGRGIDEEEDAVPVGGSDRRDADSVQGGELQSKTNFDSVESDEGVNTTVNRQGTPTEQTNDGLEGKSLSVSGTVVDDASIGSDKDNVSVSPSRSTPSSISHSGTSEASYNAHCAIPGTDANLPTCPFCNSASGVDAVTVYIEEFENLNSMYGNTYAKREAEFPGICQMPDGIKCILQHNDTMADVVFRMQWYTRNNYPVRYCYPQIISMLNSEVEGHGYRNRPQVKHAEINIDFHISSEVVIADGCRMDSYREAMESWSPPDPREHQGVAMFLSHCKEVKWRYDFIEELLKLVHIDMHGTCFHNVPEESDRFGENFEESFIAKVKKYRAVLVFENHRQEAYISEKIFIAYSARGVVPIYHGAPDVHMWLPGNHTYVDATQYRSPQALADYIKLLLTNDSVYEYHTTNYDTQKVISALDHYCPPKDDYMCHLCRHAYKLKMDSFRNGRRHCNCNMRAQ